MTQYLLSVYYDEAEEIPSDEVVQQMYADVEALNQKMQDSGAWVFAGGLHTLQVFPIAVGAAIAFGLWQWTGGS